MAMIPKSRQSRRGLWGAERRCKIVVIGTAQEKTAPGRRVRPGAAQLEDSGDNRLSRRSTIMGLAGLTAVFGMGTGVTPPVWSPEKYPAGGQARPGTSDSTRWVGHTRVAISRSYPDLTYHCPIVVLPAGCGGAASRSGWSSYSAVRTGRLKRSRAVHSRPIDLVVYQEPSQPKLLETSSRRGLRA